MKESRESEREEWFTGSMTSIMRERIKKIKNKKKSIFVIVFKYNTLTIFYVHNNNIMDIHFFTFNFRELVLSVGLFGVQV